MRGFKGVLMSIYKDAEAECTNVSGSSINLGLDDLLKADVIRECLGDAIKSTVHRRQNLNIFNRKLNALNFLILI